MSLGSGVVKMNPESAGARKLKGGHNPPPPYQDRVKEIKNISVSLSSIILISLTLSFSKLDPLLFLIIYPYKLPGVTLYLNFLGVIHILRNHGRGRGVKQMIMVDYGVQRGHKKYLFL